jgi:DNA helicase-4
LKNRDEITLKNIWSPSTFGRFFTRSPVWSLSLVNDQYQLQLATDCLDGPISELEKAKVAYGIFWTSVTLRVSGFGKIEIDGIPNARARKLFETVSVEAKRIRIAQLIGNFATAIEPVMSWVANARAASKQQFQSKGWLTRDFSKRLTELKPTGLNELLNESEVVKHLETLEQPIRDAVSLWRKDFSQVADAANESFLSRELLSSKAFLDQVEKSPLTEEQAKAVLCFDNRVLLVASAGSGKTSTMVAKAGYAVKKGYFSAEKILLLAFNRDAATELRQRIKERLESQGLQVEGLTAKTFHAFGLEIVGEATGKKPSLASWLESGQDLEILLDIVDQIKDRDADFRVKWDLFRIVLGEDLPEFGQEEESPDSWDKDSKEAGFRTLQNEVVKSRGEQLIANWLFYNGVSYKYESDYRIDTADAKHRQYKPDFYFPDIDVYLEHWAVDENGEPPPEFEGYKEGMAWKRQLHATNETTLLETTMAELWSGKAFAYLAQELTRLGITLDPNPDREVEGRRPIEAPRLIRTFRAFLTHTKSNRLKIDDLKHRLENKSAGHFYYRHKVFIELFGEIWKAWEERLQSERCIDFEDMLNSAADCIEVGKWQSPYELVMVDEFQDVSNARARLIAGLLKAEDKHLFAVGDDWQSINRFAGSDLSVMTEFEHLFGKAVTLKLEKTFRCPQSLCDISGNFIQKNPRQLKKKIASEQKNEDRPVTIIRVEDEFKIRSAIARRIDELAAQKDLSGKPLKIYVLGRYRKEREYLPTNLNSNVKVEFVTAHSSKGLEADHVIIPKMTSETLGFPSQVADDPVLQLAMPSEDSFEFAEERRLFYVALTRSRSTVTLITVAHKESSFILELVRDEQISVQSVDGKAESSVVCSRCEQGFLVQRNGPYGFFLGCSRFPKCGYTEKIKTPEAVR